MNAFPSQKQFQSDYGFAPADERCNVCSVPAGHHSEMTHEFIPGGHA
jgi:hypothetical protein